MHYFAYGSNLLQARMKHRVPRAKLVTVGRLPGYRLSFDLKVGNSGKCDILPSEGDTVWGAVYSIPFFQIFRLDKYEGHPTVYRREERKVIGTDGKEYKCQVYIGTHYGVEGTLPYDWYHHHVVLGAYQLGLPGDYQQKLRQQPSKFDPWIPNRDWESQYWE